MGPTDGATERERELVVDLRDQVQHAQDRMAELTPLLEVAATLDADAATASS